MAKPRIHFDERTDALIKKAYASRNLKSGDIKSLAQKTGISSSTLHRRAVQLGVSRIGYKHNAKWTYEELELLEKHAHHSLEWIAQTLAKNGYPKRSIEAIRSALTRQNISRRLSKNDAGIFTQADVARFMGCQTKTVNLHIKSGALKAKLRNDITSLEYQIKAKDIKHFVVNNVSMIDMTKVDKYWLVDILTGTL